MALRLAPSGVGHGRTGVWCASALCAGDFVACPFLGSGTTAVASRQLGRRFVGCDVSEAEVATTKARLRAEGLRGGGSAEGSAEGTNAALRLAKQGGGHDRRDARSAL